MKVEGDQNEKDIDQLKEEWFLHPQRNVFKPSQDRLVTLSMQDINATTRGGVCGGT